MMSKAHFSIHTIVQEMSETFKNVVVFSLILFV